MQPTTPAYRAAVYADDRWSAMRVQFQLVDVTAAEDAAPTATNECRLSNLRQTCDGVTAMGRKLATLEKDYWALDGTFEVPEANISRTQTGWWSGVLSGADGVFSVPPALTFAFTQNHTSVGFTLHFDEAAGEWPEDFTITTFGAGGNRISIDVATGNDGPVYISNMPAENYRRVEISFRKTAKPFRRVRVSEVVFGVVQTFENQNTASLTLLYETSPRMDALPVGEMTVTIDNRDHRYNIVSPNGVFRYLQEGQCLDTVLGVGRTRDGIESVNMGRHYFYRSKAADSSMTAEITARDRLFFLDKGSYRKGVNTQDTVDRIVTDILEDSGAKLTASIPPEIGTLVIGRCLPVCTHREALRCVAQAACAVCYVDRDDVLRFTKLQEAAPVDTLDLDNMETVPDIEVADRVNTVEVSAYALQDASDQPEQEKLYEGAVALDGGNTELWTVYSGPARNAVASVTGGTLVSAVYYLYAAKLVISGAGEAAVTINGIPLSRSESVYTLRERRPEETEQAVPLENPLITTTDQAKRLAAWRLSLEQRRLTYPIFERANPARGLGDTVKVFDAYGENRNAVVVRQEIMFDRTLGGTVKAWGGGL